MPPAVRVQLVRAMADIEHRLAYGTSDRLQLGALCGAFAGVGGLGKVAHLRKWLWSVRCRRQLHGHTSCCGPLPKPLLLAALSLQRQRRAL